VNAFFLFIETNVVIFALSVCDTASVRLTIGCSWDVDALNRQTDNVNPAVNVIYA
jgi:hypothetical protein